ncbi:hypothetical protein RRF57_000434 [Xylaria bambusicola]|uniref:Uncharacterized protein n=1 Tax=Xylaria bambusicola TaxID=326684 RepID=A0AAN7UA45_9PEZI
MLFFPGGSRGCRGKFFIVGLGPLVRQRFCGTAFDGILTSASAKVCCFVSLVCVLPVLLPAPEVILSVIKNLSSGTSMFVFSSHITWCHWGVVKEGQQTLPMLCKNNLLFSALYYSRKLSIVRFS